MRGNRLIKCSLNSKAAMYIAVFAVFFTLTILTPLIADDYNYAFGYASGVRIRSLRDIWDSMSWHRKLLNGRVFSHGCLSFVLMYPRWVFAALNAAVAVFFSWTTAGFFQDNKCSENPVQKTILVWMLLWICMPGFGQVFFWTAGACNYFWGAALSWFVIWRVTRLKDQENTSIRGVLWLLLPAFAAGAWSEHISFTMLIIVFLLTVWIWMEQKRFPWSSAAILLFGAAGYLYLMLAPATKLFQRLDAAGDPMKTNNLSKLIELVQRRMYPARICLVLAAIVVLLIFLVKKNNLYSFVKLVTRLAAVCGFVITVFFAFHGWKQNGVYGVISSTPAGFAASLSLYLLAFSSACRNRENKNTMILSLILPFGGMCGFALFLFGEYLPLRGFCAPVVFLVLSFACLSGTTGYIKRKKAYIGASALFLCFSLCLIFGTLDIVSIHNQAVQREKAFYRAANGDKKVIAKPLYCKTKYSAQFGNPDLYPDAGWPNGIMADYYDVIRIIVVD